MVRMTRFISNFAKYLCHKLRYYEVHKDKKMKGNPSLCYYIFSNSYS